MADYFGILVEFPSLISSLNSSRPFFMMLPSVPSPAPNKPLPSTKPTRDREMIESSPSLVNSTDKLGIALNFYIFISFIYIYIYIYIYVYTFLFDSFDSGSKEGTATARLSTFASISKVCHKGSG